MDVSSFAYTIATLSLDLNCTCSLRKIEDNNEISKRKMLFITTIGD